MSDNNVILHLSQEIGKTKSFFAVNMRSFLFSVPGAVRSRILRLAESRIYLKSAGLKHPAL